MLRAAALIVLAAPAWVLAADHVIRIEGMQFVPATLAVKAGDRVTWRNEDVVPHTATAAGGFDSGAIATGRSWSTTVRKAGRLPYACTFHPGMKAVLVVQ